MVLVKLMDWCWTLDKEEGEKSKTLKSSTRFVAAILAALEIISAMRRWQAITTTSYR